MSSIRMKVEQKIEGAISAPAVAEVLNSEMEQVRRLRLMVNVTTVLDVEPGQYFVRAQLPSGEVLRQNVSLPDNESIAEVVLSGSPSPYEWLSWQHYLGYAATNPLPLPEDTLATTWLRLWCLEDGVWLPKRWHGQPVQGNQTALVTHVTLPEGRQWLLQIGGERVPHRFIALPPAPREIQILVRGTTRNTILNGGVAIRIATFDADLEALLRYQAVGAVESAAELGDTISERAEENTRGEVGNPNGAALGFYYLLWRQDYKRLHDWPRNFANWFPWLPDSSVIYAMQLLTEPSATNQVSARQLLSKAAFAGVPVYVRGLRYLYDQLAAYKSDSSTPRSPDVDEALKRIQAYAIATDWTEPRTTFYGESPDSPNPEFVFGVPPASELLLLQPSQLADLSPSDRAAFPPQSPNEDQLIDQAQTGGRAALDQLHSLYHRRLLGYLRARSGRIDDAEDIAQQTWLSVIDKIRNYDATRGSFFAFLKYWAGINHLRWYDSRNDAGRSLILFSELAKTHPEIHEDRLVEAIVEKLERYSQPSRAQSFEIEEEYSGLLKRTFESSSPPHQLLAFGFCKLLGWPPRRFVEELSDGALSDLEPRFEKEYIGEAPGLEELLLRSLRRLREDLRRPFSEVARDPATLNVYPELGAVIAGNTRPKDYYRGKPEQNVSHWTYAVRRRVLAEIAR